MESKYIYWTEIDVRDYELDAEGIVNNANYLHYLEHTRHEFCKFAGFTFSQMRDKGIDPVLRKVEIEYLNPLRSGDTMISYISFERKGPRFIFHQDITRKGDNATVVKAVVTVVMLKDGVISKGDEVAEAFKKFL